MTKIRRTVVLGAALGLLALPLASSVYAADEQDPSETTPNTEYATALEGTGYEQVAREYDDRFAEGGPRYAETHEWVNWSFDRAALDDRSMQEGTGSGVDGATTDDLEGAGK